MKDSVLEDALSKKGAVKKVAEACGITPSAVCQWKRVPKRRVAQVAKALGLPPHAFVGGTVHLRAADVQAAGGSECK